MSANKIVFAPNVNIGQNGAENDGSFLFDCFIDHEALSLLRDVESACAFALGSTGIGKTALLRMIEKQERNCAQIELAEMAMDRLGSSDTVYFLQSLELDLGLFFQALWKHVLCIEYIKLVSAAHDADKMRHWRTRILEALFKNKSREKLERFLKENEHQFWNTTDANVIEYTEKLERNVQAELGAEVEKAKMRAGYARSLSSEKKTQIQQRAKRFVNSETLSELGQVISTLGEYTNDRDEKYFILIDRFDDHWIDESLKFKMVAALFEVLKGFQKLRNFKVVVALRNDIYERMKLESPPSRYQLEKYEDYIVRVRWTKPQLRQLAEKRINHLFRRQYSSNNVGFSDIYNERVGGGGAGGDTWKYMVERTLSRPRDIINFINFTLQAAEGKATVSRNDFRIGEVNYSNIRYTALLDEWSGTYPAIKPMIELLRAKTSHFEISKFATPDLEEVLYFSIGSSELFQKDSIWNQLERSLAGDAPMASLQYAAIILHRLHLVGAVGLKLDSLSSWQWFHETSRPVTADAITMEAKIMVHPMLKEALRIT